MVECSPNCRVAERVKPGEAQLNDNLELYLRQIGAIFDVAKIVDECQDIEHIVNYYRTLKFPLLLVYDRDGFYHYGISYDGKYKTDDLKESPRLVENYMHDIDAKNVLELAYGRGTNTAFLARRNPHITFEAVDISNKPLRSYATLPNARFKFCDVHDLRSLRNNSYDLAFVIEGLSASTNKLQVLQEVKKKLKRDGLFIVIDGYQRDRPNPLTPSEQLMWGLIEKSLSVQKIERVSEVENYMRREYSIVEFKDLSPCVIPSMMRFVPAARFYFSHSLFARAVNAFLPFDMVKNTIFVLLLPIAMHRQIACYCVHALRKAE
ncbi:MAG: class I SAM-dependent methyltransferase [Halobacteriota archaeon]